MRRIFFALTLMLFKIVNYLDKKESNIQINVLFPNYFPDRLNPQLNSKIKQRASISYTSVKREEQDGYTLYLSPFEHNELQKYPNMFSNMQIIVKPTDKENTKHREDTIERNEYEYNNIVVKSYSLNYEDVFTEENLSKTILSLVFVYNEKDYVVSTGLYGKVSNEMLMEIERELLKVVESMLLPVVPR